MTTAEWLAVVTAGGTAIGGGVTLAARLIVAVIRELIVTHKEHTVAQRETTAAVAELKLGMVALRERVDAFLDITPIRPVPRDDEPSSVRGPFPLRGGRKDT